MKNIFVLCLPYLNKHKFRLLSLVLLHIGAGLLSVVFPYISGSFIDALILGEAASKTVQYVSLIAALATAEFVLGYICERLYIHLQCRCGHALNADAIQRIQRLSFRYMQSRNASFINMQINNDANAVVIFCITVLQNMITNAFTLLIPFVLITRMELWLGLALLVVNLVYFLLYYLFKGRLYNAQLDFMNEQADYFSKLEMQLSNVKFIQTHGLANSYILRLSRSLEKLIRRAFRMQSAQYAFTGSDVIIKYAANIIVFIIGGHAVIRGDMTDGEFTIVLSYFAMTLSATQFFFSLGKDIQSSRVSRDRLQKIFDECEQTNGKQHITEIESIECRNVSFGYGDSDRNILTNLDTRFEKGDIYAFVGDNGTGKSTLINLLLGLFIDSYDGQVSYNGIPIEKLDMRSIRHDLVGVSEQEPMLLEETLKYNLTFDDQAVLDDTEFHDLCKVLNLESLLRSLPQGLDTVINEGTSNLSGGEKQKISILRALLKHPKLLVLDEPTSAFDKESKGKFVDYLASHCSDKIVFISTHDEDVLKICSGKVILEKTV